MMKYSVIFLALLCIAQSTLSAQVRLVHNPPQGYVQGESFELEALVQGTEQPINQVILHYRTADENVYRETRMEFRYGYYIGEIPSDVSSAEAIQYVITAELSNGQQVVYPENTPFEEPAVVHAMQSQQQKRADSSQDQLDTRDIIPLPVGQESMIISPSPDEPVSPENALIAVSLYYLENVDSSSILVSLDGNNVTEKSKISDDLIVYNPGKLEPGNHQAKILLKRTNGQSYESLSWVFHVSGAASAARETELKVDGRLYLETSQAEIRNQTENINKLSSSFRGSYRRITVDGNLYLTSQENPDTQPRNRYLLRAKGNNFQFELGDSYPRLSSLGMWGKRLRGVNSEVNLGRFNLQLAYGRSMRAEAGRIIPLSQVGNSADVSNEIIGYTFDRRIFAVRPSFGKKEKFQLGFSLVSSRDDTSSVNNYTDNIPAEDVRWGDILPKDNIVVGTDLFLAFDRQRIIWESSASLSWQNNNIFGGAVESGDVLEFGSDYVINVSDLPVDPSQMDWLFIVNNNMYPYLPIPAKYSSEDTGTTNFDLQLQPFNISDYRSLAFETELQLNYFRNNIGIRYRKVGDAYNALMNPYIRSDIAGFEIRDQVGFMQNRLFLNIAYENLNEGLSGEQQNQINSDNFRAGISLYPGGNYPSLHVNHSLYNRQNQVDSIEEDTLTIGGQDSLLFYDNRIHNMLSTSTLNISQPIHVFGIRHNLGMNFMRSAREDRISRTGEFPAQDYTLHMVSVSIQSRYEFPLVTRLSFTSNNNDGPFGVSEFQTIGIGGRYKLFRNKLVFNGSYHRTQSAGQTEFSRDDFEATVFYNILNKHKITANARYSFIGNSAAEYNDFIYRLRYTYEF